ncbi:hypothetical protein TNCV_675031 [Trichonephila clavipes]|nr:hypothetical protein TNCV_675031 [Trichonephila clavipes]
MPTEKKSPTSVNSECEKKPCLLFLKLYPVTNSRPVLKLKVVTWTDPKHCACASVTPAVVSDYLSTREVDFGAPPVSVVCRFGKTNEIPMFLLPQRE